MADMRVLWFTDVLPEPVRMRVGLPPNPGPQAWVDRLAEELVRGGGEVELELAAPCVRAFESFVAGGVRYHGLPVPQAAGRLRRLADDWRHRLVAPETLAAAGALIERLRPGIVHVHGTESAFGTVAAAGAAPCVVSLQGLLQQYARAYFAGRTPSEVMRLFASAEFLKGYGVAHGYLRYRRLASREAEVMRSARWFIGRTDWDRAALAATNPDAVYFHCDEIMRTEFWVADRDRHGPRDGSRLYTTSSAMPFKGTETLLEALAVLRRRGEGDLRLRIAGVPRDSELQELYRRAAQRFGVEDAVDWLGRLPATAIAEELVAADVFVYPSHIDNSPNAVVEAMLIGAPIVASYAGGIPSLLRDGEEGLLVPRGDAPALAAAIARLLDDPDLAERLGAAARRRARHRNDPARIVARTVEIYREIIATERRADAQDGEVQG